jgi:hypothetical protein
MLIHIAVDVILGRQGWRRCFGLFVSVANIVLRTESLKRSFASLLLCYCTGHQAFGVKDDVLGLLGWFSSPSWHVFIWGTLRSPGASGASGMLQFFCVRVGHGLMAQRRETTCSRGALRAMRRENDVFRICKIPAKTQETHSYPMLFLRRFLRSKRQEISVSAIFLWFSSVPKAGFNLLTPYNTFVQKRIG